MNKVGKLQHRWTEEEKEYVRTHYMGNNASAQQIADDLHQTKASVKGQVQLLGCAKVVDRQPWSAKERERLAELVPMYSPRRVAKMMQRPVNSVVSEMKRLRIKRRMRTGWFTKREVCEILGQDHKWVQKRIDRGELKATYHHGKRPKQAGLAMWHIWEEDLAIFIREHARELDGRNVDLPSIVWLVGIRRTKKKKNGKGGANGVSK